MGDAWISGSKRSLDSKIVVVVHEVITSLIASSKRGITLG
jgi:hypothetical protein